MRPSRRHPLPAAHDRPPPARLPRGIAAPSDRSGGVSRRQRGRMRSPFADSERDRLIAAILPNVAFDGWSRHSLRMAARRAGVPVGEAMALFPRGAPDLVAAFSRWADRQMLDRLEATPSEPASLSRRVALALPQNAPLGLRLLYETVDGLWYGVGDSSTDFSFYTKRATLAGIYAAAVLYWLDDRSPGGVATDAF